MHEARRELRAHGDDHDGGEHAARDEVERRLPAAPTANAANAAPRPARIFFRASTVSVGPVAAFGGAGSAFGDAYGFESCGIDGAYPLLGLHDPS